VKLWPLQKVAAVLQRSLQKSYFHPGEQIFNLEDDQLDVSPFVNRWHRLEMNLFPRHHRLSHTHQTDLLRQHANAGPKQSLKLIQPTSPQSNYKLCYLVDDIVKLAIHLISRAQMTGKLIRVTWGVMTMN
jgi:hypothetical protein